MTEELLPNSLSATHPSVLVVDDDASNIQLLYSMLESDFRVVVANSGRQALKLLERDSEVDLMLLDVDMPVISGFEVLAQVRASKQHQSLPIIMVTGQNDLEHEARALEQGANDFISKPVTAPTVKARIKTQLSLAASTNTITQKNQELELSFAKLQKAKNELSEFMMLVSHELRTPIAILQCETELLCDQVRKPTEQNLNSLLDEVKHVSALLTDMFDLVLSESSALRYEKSRCSLKELIMRSKTLFDTQFNSKELSVHLNMGEQNEYTINADAKRIRQVIDNILGNSLKYTDHGGKLFITLKQNETELVIRFEDSSPGVPKEDLSKLFKRFFRVEKSRNRSSGGSGLGLAICKTIIEAHQGTITASHSSHGGLSLEVRLPLFTATSAASQDSKHQQTN